MGKAFLLLITLERAESFPLNALLDTVNLIAVIVFLLFVTFLIIGTKLQKNVVFRKKMARNFPNSNYF
jgi:hypothetical protein